MNTAIVSSIIGTVGAAFIAVLVFFCRPCVTTSEPLVRASTRWSRVWVRASTRWSRVWVRASTRWIPIWGDRRQARSHRTTQEEHGRQLARIADHGERIAALEGAVAATS